MQILKKDFCELSKISIDDISNEKLNEIFTLYWSDEIYVLNDKKMVGIITRGDYLRALGKQKISVNENYKFIMESSDTLDKAQEIFYKFKNINSVPILNDKKELLYIYSVKNKGYINDNEFKWITDDYTIRFMQILDIHNFNPPLSEYFKLNNFNNIFIFGNDYLCNTISVELSNIADINIIGVLTMTDIINGILNTNKILNNIHKADLLFMADFRYLDEYKIVFDKINIRKISLYEVLMSYTTLQSINKLLINISLLKDELLNNNTNVRFYYFRFPKVSLVKNPSKNELSLFDGVKINREALKTPDNLYYEDELLSYIPQIKKGDLMFHKDLKSKYVNIIDGYRITTDNPDNYENTIYIFGSSVAFGCGSEDKYTIASCLQRIINSKLNKKYKVVNCGINAMMDKDVLKHINNIEFKSGEGDIVIIINTCHENMVRKYTSEYNIIDNLQPIFDRPHDLDEIFIDTIHMNWKANQIIAEKIFESAVEDVTGKNTLNLNKIQSLDNLNFHNKSNISSFDNNPELLKYLTKLKEQKVDIQGKIGCIVVNCNPFTLGHLYLIEKSLTIVDFLYIFVVEEENPHFSFKDRFELVKKGTEHLNNVKIIPSGKFLISILTFPDYFNKENDSNIIIDPSQDINLFAKYIAPTLNIKVRFVGEEPNDYITRQYNNSLKCILPRYGIEFIEFPRKEFGLYPISASSVRKLLKDKNFNKLKDLVPFTTYEYLLKLYK